MLDEFTDSVHEITGFDLLREVLFGEIGQTNKKMHQNTHWDIFFD